MFRSVFLSKPLLSGILLSTFTIFVLRIAVFTKPLACGILFPTFPIYVFRTVVVTKPFVSGIFFSALPIFEFKTVVIMNKRSMFNEINNYPHWVITKVFQKIKEMTRRSYTK